MRKRVTMQDIADKLGISVVAVSKALSGKKGVSEQLRSKIKRTADEMGYKPPDSMRKKSGTSGNIGIIVAERYISDNSFYFKFIRALTADLQAQGYYGFIHTLTMKNEEEVILPDIFLYQRVDGIIMLGQVSDGYTNAMKNMNIPIVFLDFYNELTADRCVVSDNFYGSYEMTNYLIRNGHKNIAFVGNIHATSSIQDRYLGYSKSLLEHNIPIHSGYVLNDRDETGNFTPVELPMIMPTAFVCNCDEVACRLIAQLRENGYLIPKDISVTGFDNSVYSSISTPNITTVEVNTEKMAHIAVESLINSISKPAAQIGMVVVKGNILYRDSVASINDY